VTARYLLDTDTASFAIRGVGRVKDNILARVPGEIAISVLTEAELWFGVNKLASRKLARSVEGFLGGVEVLGFDRAAARDFGELQALLVARGRPIGVVDAMLAAHARSQDLCFVTHNRRHFDRVPKLVVDDWV
jgi:tRNA(fMet)-specific endonuclease VapC